MNNVTRVIWQILMALVVMAIPIGALAGSHMTGPPPVQLAEIDPYVHRSNFVVADMARAFRVYRDILGFKVDVLVPATSFMHAVFELSPEAKLRIAFLSSGEGEFGHIGLTEFPDMEPPSADSIHSSVLIVEVQRDIETLFDQLKAEGLDVERIFDLTNPSRREIPFTDHDGHRVILMRLDRPE